MKVVEQESSFRHSKRAANLLLLTVLMVWAICSHRAALLDLSLPFLAHLTPTKIQIIAFPIVLLLLSRLFLFQKRIPRLALFIAVLGAAVGVGYSYSHVSLAKYPLLVAQLHGDQLEVETSVLREAINAQITNSSVHGIRHYDSIDSHQEALALLQLKNDLQGLIWGDTRLLHGTFPKGVQHFPSEQSIETWTRATKFQLVTSVPEIILPFKPRRDTAEYIGNVFSALPQLQEYAAEILLKSSATQWGLWRFKTHRGFSWWVLGNWYLAKALANGGYERAELMCAINAYTHARKLVTLASHPELAAAILNNRAFAHYIQALMEGRRDLRKLARKELRIAAANRKFKNPLEFQYVAPKIARTNAKLFKRKNKHTDHGLFRGAKKKHFSQKQTKHRTHHRNTEARK